MTLPEHDQPKLSEIIPHLTQRMVRLEPGSLARLRRMDPEGPGEAEFWKLAIECGLGTSNRHQRLVQLLGLLTPKGEPQKNAKTLHDGSKPFGKVLAKTDYPEMRLMRFLALPFEQRDGALERMIRWVAAKGHDGVNCTDIAMLLLSANDGPPRKLAETYYRQKYVQENKEDAA
ncbi:MAG: hypothetical protein ACKOAM_01050 [Chakrabartia sp.]